jgi:hypothetical protein
MKADRRIVIIDVFVCVCIACSCWDDEVLSYLQTECMFLKIYFMSSVYFVFCILVFVCSLPEEDEK